MSSPRPQPTAKSSSVDEHRWVIQIRRTIEEEVEEEEELANLPVTIFSVPKILMATDPESYIPQQVAIGPYHHWRPELYEMERYKLSASKRSQKQFQSDLKFRHLVDELTKLEPKVRACYHKYLDFHSETLAWMMAIDICFLLEFLQVHALKQGRQLKRVESRMSHLLDTSGRKSAYNAILRDIVMVENQIPMFLLKKVLEFRFSSMELVEDTLNSMLIGLYKDLSPFELMEEELAYAQGEDCAHILDFLYRMIVPKSNVEVSDMIVADHERDEITKKEEGEEKYFGEPGYVKQFFDEIWKLLSKLNAGPVSFIKRLIFAKPVTLVMKLPWKILSNLPGLKLFKDPIESLFSSSQDKEEVKPENENSNTTMITPPLIEEITIPSVTELSKAGVCFSPTNGGVLNISFDEKTLVLHLPIVNLDVNTEVILRNLVAYEASNSSGPLVFTRYTEFMNGIIDTEEDAQFLRERGIVLNHLKSDKEVASLWNGMSKSVKLTKVPFLDRVIEGVNKHYSRRWKVKFAKYMKVYVFGSWKFLTLLAAVFLLVLTMLQAFCSVYSCARIFRLPDFRYDTSTTD